MEPTLPPPIQLDTATYQKLDADARAQQSTISKIIRELAGEPGQQPDIPQKSWPDFWGAAAGLPGTYGSEEAILKGIREIRGSVPDEA